MVACGNQVLMFFCLDAKEPKDQGLFSVHFLCLSKENEPKERTLFEGIFKLRLKPSCKLRVASLLNLGALPGLFCRKDYFLRTSALELENKATKL